jgi:site-specific recombinase XerD
MTDELGSSGQADEVDDVLDVVMSVSRRPASVRGELVAPADELVDAFALTYVASVQTQRTYERACRRFVRWLGPLAGPEDLTAAAVSRYHAWLVAGGRSSATVKKDRAALNSFLRWLAAHDKVPAAQAREALAVRLPRAQRADRETPKALDEAQYERLLREAKARIADDTLRGVRDHAIVLVLGDAGLRCEELSHLQVRDFRAAREGAQLRALDVRHGKGDRARVVKLSPRTSRAIVRWDRERTRTLGAPHDTDPLFITVGRRGRDGTYQRAGARCSQAVLSEVLKTLGALAELPDDLRHPHALRHTCATHLLQHGANVADVRRFLGHASVKTTSIYLASDDTRQEEIVTRRAHGRSALAASRDHAA